MQTRRDLLKASGFGLVAMVVRGVGRAATPSAAKPNVILVMTDDQGYGDLACHGNPELRTPNLDRLRTQSIRMTDFHVAPFCTPTRAALMTGRYSGQAGCDRQRNWMPVLRQQRVQLRPEREHRAEGEQHQGCSCGTP